MTARLPTHIIGAGGGKDGESGGSSPVESPDSLRSKQYARVIDLVSEGEIEGLVDGLKSVYLDGTPIQNADGSYNFKDVSLITRTGTQAQSSIPGFPTVESERAVGAEIKASQAVTRSITNVNADAMRVTISVPQLTFQNTETGDLTGTSVTLQIDTQSNGGGFVPYAVGKKWDASGIVLDAAAYRVWQGVQKYGIGIRVRANLAYPDPSWYPGEGAPTEQPILYGSVIYDVQYRAIGAGAWTTLAAYTLSGADVSTGGKEGGEPVMPERTYRTAELPLDDYEMRVVRTGGTGPTTLTVLGGESYSLDYDLIITGKTTSRYQRSLRVELAGSPPWDVRVRRVTADSTASNLRNATWWDSYTELIDARLRWPNSALMALSIDAAQFRTIPTRGYLIKGVRLRLPSNYNPHDRSYTGAWDGTFQIAWSNNPAWVFYDLVTNERYGLGEFIDAAQVDKWALYEIAQYCDELVPDGFGGMEPRFTCNLYLQTREEAYRVINNMASIFRGIVFWSAGAITAVQDAPADTAMQYTAANVIEGRFNYQGSARKTRHTVALVSWNDPADHFRQKIEYVEDEDGIARYGIQQIELVGFGCASRGLAHRIGRWLLYSERMETETVTFRAGLDGTFCWPGAVIRTTDPARAGKRHGGRVVAATASSATLDAAVTLESGKTYTINVILPDGTQESRAVTTGAGTTATLAVTPNFTTAPQAQSVWTLTASDLVPETWRALAITEVDKTQYEITALTHRVDKFAAVEQNLVLEPLQTSAISTRPSQPTDVDVVEGLYLVTPTIVGARMTVSWLGTMPLYELQYRAVGSGNWTTVTVTSCSVDIQPVEAGDYEFSLVGINALGLRSAPLAFTKTIYGLSVVPANVSGFTLAAIGGAAHLAWNPSADLDVVVGGHLRIRHTSDTVTPEWSSAVDIGPQIPGSATTAVLPLLAGTYLAKWIDSGGRQSAAATGIITDAPSVLGLNIAETVTEHPAFAGVKTNVAVIDGALTLDSALTIDEMLDPIDDWPRLSALGGISTSGEYAFDGSVDLGSVQTSRLTAALKTLGVDLLDLIDERPNVDTWPSVDGELIDDVSCTLYVRTTPDDPAGTPTWSAWAPFVVGDYTARAFQFKAVLATAYVTHNILLSELAVTVDMPDREEAGEDIVSGAGTYSVVYTLPFMVKPAVSITAQDMATGDYYTISNKTVAGFDIVFRNAAGTAVSRTFDHRSRSY